MQRLSSYMLAATLAAVTATGCALPAAAPVQTAPGALRTVWAPSDAPEPAGVAVTPGRIVDTEAPESFD